MQIAQFLCHVGGNIRHPHDIGMNGKHYRAGFRKADQALPFRPGIYLCRRPGPAFAFKAGLMQGRVVVDQGIGAPKRLVGADRVEQSLHAAGDIRGVGLDGDVDFRHRAAEFLRQGPAGGEAEDRGGEDVFGTGLFEDAEIFLKQATESEERLIGIEGDKYAVGAADLVREDFVAGSGGQGFEKSRVEFFGGRFCAGSDGVDEGGGGFDQTVTFLHLSGKGVVEAGPVIVDEGQDSRQPGGARVHPGGKGQV